MIPISGPRRRFPGRRGSRRAGQTLIFLLALVVILAVVVLWNFDLHKVLSVKLRSQHAGDAAALAAARWQGASLNLIGHLNVLQAVAVSDALVRGETEFPEAEALAELRARLAYVGPMTAFSAAQQAARQNGLFNRPHFTRMIHAHAERVREHYPAEFEEPYRNRPSPPSAWDDYAGMIEAISTDGVAAFPENARWYADYRHRQHLLLNPDFYDAIALSNWCWFYFHARSWLEGYQSFRDWPALPDRTRQDPGNAEFFSLGVTKMYTLLSIGPASPEEVWDELHRQARAAGRALDPEGARGLPEAVVEWTGYDPRTWFPWTEFLPARFPFTGEIRVAANVVGADAVVRTEAAVQRVSPGGGSEGVTWSAAAKPFGSLEGEPPHRFGLVLPAFRDVRLIPIDASTAPAAGSRPGWHAHLFPGGPGRQSHLDSYLARGLNGLDPDCWYCRQLVSWEDAAFRQAGREWLDHNAQRCVPPGSGRGGGSRRGH